MDNLDIPGEVEECARLPVVVVQHIYRISGNDYGINVMNLMHCHDQWKDDELSAAFQWRGSNVEEDNEADTRLSSSS